MTSNIVKMTFYFIKAETREQEDDSNESVMYHTRFVSICPDKARRLCTIWNRRILKKNWLRRFFSDVHHYRVVEVITPFDFYNVQALSSVYINYRTLEMKKEKPEDVSGRLFSQVFLSAVYDKGLSEEPRKHKDEYDLSIVTTARYDHHF
jgi:hypothetical protein